MFTHLSKTKKTTELFPTMSADALYALHKNSIVFPPKFSKRHLHASPYTIYKHSFPGHHVRKHSLSSQTNKNVQVKQRTIRTTDVQGFPVKPLKFRRSTLNTCWGYQHYEDTITVIQNRLTSDANKEWILRHERVRPSQPNSTSHVTNAWTSS